MRRLKKIMYSKDTKNILMCSKRTYDAEYCVHVDDDDDDDVG